MTAALTSLSHGAGCGCKLSAADLRPILAGLPRPDDPRVLVAADTGDDRGIEVQTDAFICRLIRTLDSWSGSAGASTFS